MSESLTWRCVRASSSARALILVVSAAAGGCYEELEPPAATPAAGAPQQAPAPAAGTLQQDTARPGQAGARQAAQNTVDKVEERQQELEKMLEDP